MRGKDTEWEDGVKGRGRCPGVPERSGGSDRLDAGRLRVILEALNPRRFVADRACHPREGWVRPHRESSPGGHAAGAAERSWRVPAAGWQRSRRSDERCHRRPATAALQPTLDVDEAAFAEVAGGEVCELTPEDDVEEIRGRLPVDRDPDGRDVLAGCGLPQLGAVNESPDEGRQVDRVSPALVAAEAVWFFVLLVVLLRISAPPVVWIDATVRSGPIAERNRSEGMQSRARLGPCSG